MLVPLTILLSFFADLPAAEASAPVAAILRSEALARGRVVLLREVASPEGAREEEMAQIGAISLGFTPHPGYSRFISRQTVADHLAAAGFGPDRVEVRGAEGVLVKVRSAQLPADRLIETARAFLEGELARLDGEFLVAVDRPPRAILVPAGESLSSLEAKWRSAPQSSGTVHVDVQVKVDGSLYTTVPLQFRVRRFDRVLVALREIGRDEAFTGANTAVVRTEITEAKGTVARSLEDLSAYRSRRSLEAGSILRIEDGYLPALVEKGRPVHIVVKKGTLAIRARGVARQDGAMGDVVEILNPDSGRTFQSVVVGPDEVVVKL